MAIGITNLLELLIRALRDLTGGPPLMAGDSEAVRREVSIYAAIAIVALPIWLLHWWLAERGRHGPDSEGERRSSVRALYLAGVLTGALFAAIVAAVRLLQATTLWIVSTNGADAPGSGEFWIALLAVSVSILAYHGCVRLGDMRACPLEEEADWLPRLYVYLAAFIGLTLLTFAVGESSRRRWSSRV